MLTERIREILQQKKRGYSEVPASVIDVVTEMNDQYYIGRKFQLKRQKDGTVTLTDRKNNITLELREGRMCLTDMNGDRVGRTKYDASNAITALKSIHDNYVPMWV